MIRSIRTKLVLLFMALAAVPMVAVGVASYLNSLSSVQAVVEHRAAAAARAAAEELQALYRSRLGEVELLARNQEVRDLYGRYRQVGGAAVDELRPRLDRFFGQFLSGTREAFARVSYLDRDGELILQYARTDAETFGAALGRYSLAREDASLAGIGRSAMEIDRRTVAFVDLAGSGPALRVARRIENRRTGEPLGLLLADLEIAPLLNGTALGQAFSPSEYLALIDRESGRVLYQPAGGAAGQNLGDLVPGLTVDQLVPAEGASGSVSWTTDQGEWVLAYAHQDEPAWTVAAISDAALFTGPPRRAAARNLAVAVGSAAVALLLLLWTATRIGRSIRRVADGAEAIAGGDLNQQINVDARDETSVLADAFNMMAASLRGTLGQLRQLTAELEDRVRQRTADLEEANTQLERQFQDLEVERALERVRTEVAAMEHSDDLPRVVAVVRTSLVDFGVPCDNVGINIADPQTERMRAFSPEGQESFKLSDATLAAFSAIRSHSDIAANWREHWRAQSTYSRSYDAQDWHRFCDQARAAGFGDAVEAFMSDPQARALVEIPRWVVDAYFPQGSLAMNRESREPFADEHIALLERFTEVFALGYTRYLDLKAAEERARQAELERAVERVRAEALGMRTSDDLLRLVAVLYREMLGLSMEIQWANIYFVDESAATVTLYAGHPSLRATGMSWTSVDMVDFDGTCGAHRYPPTPLTGWRHAEGFAKGEPSLSTWQMSHQEVGAWVVQHGIQHLTPDFVQMLEGEHALILVPFAHGIVSLAQDELHEEYVDIIRAFAEALSLGFVRFLDFQQLEERNRQMDLSRARHRVRSEVLAMTSTDDIDQVILVLREELGRLGVPTDQVGINIIDEEADQVRTQWTSALAVGSAAQPSVEDSHVGQQSEPRTPATARLIEYWRRREVWSRSRSDGVSSGLTGWVVDVPFDYGTLAMNRGQLDSEASAFLDNEVEALASFADVVSLGYTRFLDFQRLEEQNRRLATEGALERIRAEVASMQSTDDIGRIMALALVELRGLGSRVETLNVAVVDEAARMFRQYVLVPHEEYRYGLRGTPAVSGIVEAVDMYRGDRPFYQPTDWALDRWRSGESRISTFDPDYFTRPSTVEQYRKQFGLDISEATSFVTHTMEVPFSAGLLLFLSRAPGGPGEADLATAEEFARMLSLGYARFLDFQAAEERARELTLDRAVERVRAEATAMREPADVRHVMMALWKGLGEAGLELAAGVVQTADQASNSLVLYGALPAANLAALGDPIPESRIVEKDALPGVHLARTTVDLDWARQRGYAMPGIEASVATMSATFHEELQAVWGGGPWPAWVSGTQGLNVPFSNGGIFVQLPPEITPTEEHLHLVERFADAVSLGYRRYLDLKGAERRAAQQAIEASSERVRATAMSMQTPDDIRSVAGVLFEEMQRLGIQTPGVGIDFRNPRTGEVTTYLTNRNFRRYGLQWTSPDVAEFSDEVMTYAHPASEAAVERLRALTDSGEPSSGPDPYSMDFLVEYGRTNYGIEDDKVRSNPLLAEVWVGDWMATAVPFAYGDVSFRERELNEAHVAIAQELAEALSLGFVRFLDFQRLEEQNKALEAANDEIQQANRLKSEFLANMSHELRTPMNAIVGFSKLVYRKAKGVLDERQVGNLEKVLQSSEILLALINDILDLSKIEAGRLEIQPEEFDIRELVASCLDTVSPLVKRGVAVEAALSDEVGMVYSDPSRVRQILINLLSNAGKFTEAGTITVGLKPAGENVLELSVTDTGIGIPKTAMDAIFEEFRQVDGTTTRKYGGTGLGLSISQRLAGMLGGGIRVESEEGVGSTFTVSIAARYGQHPKPAPPPDDAVSDADDSPGAGASLNRRIILAIDDDPNVISLISQELEEEGYQVVGATRALEGIEKARSMRPCAITLDIMMPGMDGWEAISRLKADPATRDIPVIVISIIDNKELGYRLGADEYLVKPVEKDALLRSLKRFARGGGEALVIDDDPAVVELVTQLLEEDGWQVTGATDGQDGLNKLRRRPPDVVLLDLMMPVMDGFETLKMIRASRSPKIRDLPVIIVTAKDLSAQERQDLLQNTTRIIEKDGLDRERLLHELRASLVEMRG